MTAPALGLTIPSGVLAIADEVVEITVAVAVGSIATEMGCPRDVRFTPVSDH